MLFLVIMNLMIQLLLYAIMILLSIGFISLMERKLLSLMQNRKGPNKVGLMGILQPIADAMKLIGKDNNPPDKSMLIFYYGSPVIFFLLLLLNWITLPIYGSMISFYSSILFVILLASLSVYGLIMMGWFSNSKYALIGAVRSIAQSISYEIVFTFAFFSVMIVSMSISLKSISEIQSKTWLVFPMIFLMILFLITILAESNRTPFDLSESESELVSGYCIEYGGISYTLIFMGEVSSLLFFSILITIMFSSTKAVVIKSLMFLFLFIWIRATLPRIRFDKMMSLCWISFMPVLLGFILMYILLSS
nr:NADH dehydrogenase subunit 1 [Fulicoffula longipila]